MSATSQVNARAPFRPRQTHIETAPKLTSPNKVTVSQTLVKKPPCPSPAARTTNKAT
ncbi:hypothetical protein SAMN05444858_104349 [Micromonospora avicenniae]|uniref:Uncharacterized protein n=1 Tax=Micromonospora avicenniae TaxID=1198245 RepID=A0A1N6W467_9ACTN|nr:hypothetical protein SAMN05444858_104349 [Micromonospora avicenniae]